MLSNVLSPRLRQVLSLAREGHTAVEIAYILGLSYRTVGQYLSDCYKRLGARNRMQAVAIAIQRGEIAPMPSAPASTTTLTGPPGADASASASADKSDDTRQASSPSGLPPSPLS